MEIWETASAKRNAGSKRWIAVAIIGKLYKNGKSKEEMKSEKLGGLRETVGAVPPTRDDQKQCNSLQNECAGLGRRRRNLNNWAMYSIPNSAVDTRT